MRNYQKGVFICILLCTGCTAKIDTQPIPEEPQVEEKIIQEEPKVEEKIIQEEVKVDTITMHINDTTLRIKLYQHEAVDAFVEQLPLELQMGDLHENEKYYYFNQTFPTQPQQVNTIQEGDLMLYGSDCLVLFYKDFPTSFAYTSLGYVEDRDKLSEILPQGDVNIRFSKE